MFYVESGHLVNDFIKKKVNGIHINRINNIYKILSIILNFRCNESPVALYIFHSNLMCCFRLILTYLN